MFSLTQARASEPWSQRFVRLLYFSFLGREASDIEVATQVNSGQSPTQLAMAFLNTPEFNLGGRFIAGLYVGLLNRDAEFTGWQFQRGALSTGLVTQDALVANFLGAAEPRVLERHGAKADFVPGIRNTTAARWYARRPESG